MTRSKSRLGVPEQRKGQPATSEPTETVALDQPIERIPVADDPGPIADRLQRDAPKPARVDPLADAAELARNGQLQDSIAAYRDYLTHHPEDVSARRALASVLEHRGDFVGALGELGRAIDARPEDVSLLCSRAAVQMALQRYEQADSDLRRASKIDADNPEVLFGLGMLLCKKARWREAIAPLQRAVELDASNPQGHYYLGEAYNQTDQLKLGLASYEEAVRLQPMNYRALKGVGIVLDKLGRPAEATAAYQRAREAQRR